MPAKPLPLLLSALLFILLLAAAPVQATPPAPTFADTLVELANQERETNGELPPLKRADALEAAAAGHTQAMAERDFLMHCDPDTGATLTTRAEAAGYTDWTRLTENIAAGYNTPTAVMAAWMASPGHRANILDPNVNEIGAGHVHQTDDQANVRQSTNGNCPAAAASGPYYHYWTQDFGRRAAVYPLVIAREALTVASLRVSLYVYGPAAATQMRFRNDGGAWSDWQPYSPPAVWDLAAGNGPKQVFVEVTDGSAASSAEDAVYLHAPPPVAPAAEIANVAPPTLSWPHAPANLHYDIYRSASAPYFTPGGSEASLIAAALPPPAEGGIMAFGDDTATPGLNYYYQILAVAGDGVTTAASQRVGRFLFDLTPGSPTD